MVMYIVVYRSGRAPVETARQCFFEVPGDRLILYGGPGDWSARTELYKRVRVANLRVVRSIGRDVLFGFHP